MRVAIVRSADSPPTVVLYQLGEIIKRRLIEWGYDVMDIQDPFRASGIFNARVLLNNDIIIYLGHGEVDRLYGNFWLGYWIPFLAKRDKDLVRKKVVITYACLSGRELGPYLVSNDTRAYAGSDYYMYVAYDTEIQYSKYYFEPFLAFIEDFFRKGKSLASAIITYRNLALRNVAILNNLGDPTSRDYAYYLRLNAEHYKVIGDAQL